MLQVFNLQTLQVHLLGKHVHTGMVDLHART